MLQTFEPASPASLHYVPAPTPPISTPGTPPNTSAASNPAKPSADMTIKPQHNILIVTGPAGCGKSTVAKFLADRYGFRYIEGDDFHPPTNIEKMSKNIPLNDEDRWDWLITLRDQALSQLKSGAHGVVITCSALKKKYRDVIRTARLYDEDPNANVRFVYLKASKEVLLQRVGGRQGHYMKDTMVLSQLAALEEPSDDETRKLHDVDIVDVSGSTQEVQDLVSAVVDKALQHSQASS
ncbi:carbohydrate kinase [Bimuria novae-zelandiae CBS 107.79]|uniref:Gluconokinase n=1 Tax=Bimuria novae-zelandiae CBS 107.79 TaxID=1447943 RepID=A0A6A5UV59_9PLEO|nr:carbohydrate kinase [Bimuria novae-zelandiae CBS 107.79]